jgi:hypothetical protein
MPQGGLGKTGQARPVESLEQFEARRLAAENQVHATQFLDLLGKAVDRLRPDDAARARTQFTDAYNHLSPAQRAQVSDLMRAQNKNPNLRFDPASGQMGPITEVYTLGPNGKQREYASPIQYLLMPGSNFFRE